MQEDGIQRALVFVTSVFSSYSGCRQYREDVIRACETIRGNVPVFDKLRVFYNHPGFVVPMAEKVRKALAEFPADELENVHVTFTAHSIPISMANHSEYVAQLEDACRLVAEYAGVTAYSLAYQSRSGPPHVPWLEPDIGDHLRALKVQGATQVVVVPIGFISDHMEVMFDLDTEAKHIAAEMGLELIRAETVGTHPDFVCMIRELILERMTADPQRRALGDRGPDHDICPLNCCLKGEGGRGHPHVPNP
jgi:ferrochelatase